MSADLLLGDLERITESSSDALRRLRGFVLDLAVSGKLVEQRIDEEPAESLLARIRNTKAEAGAKTRARKSGSAELPMLDADALPSGWAWTCLADIGWLSPRNEASDDCLTSFVPMTEIPAPYGLSVGYLVRPWREIKKGYTHFAEGDVGLAKITPCFENGKSTVFRGLTGGMGAGTTELHVVRPILVDPDYLLIFLKSPSFIEPAVSQMTGTAGQKRVSRGYFAFAPLPLPPLEEQRRIVAKVDELLSVCDKLEVARNERERHRDALRSVSLHRLTTDGHAADVRFFLDKSPRLITSPEHVVPVRRSILDLAVQGSLVPQDAGDEPAASWLARECPSSAADRLDDDHDANRPVGWDLVTVGRLASMITSGSRGWAEHYSQTGAAFLRAQNIRFGRLRLDSLAHVTLPGQVEGSRTRTEVGDLLVVITGAGVTNPAILDVDLGEAYVSQHIGLIKLRSKVVARWVLLCLMADAGARSQLVASAYGAGKPGLNLNNLRSLEIPLPPLAEQHRILAKLDELTAMCDELEAALATARTSRSHALEALLRDVLDEGARSSGANAPLATAT